MVVKGEEGGIWAKWVKGNERYKYPVIEQVSHENKRYNIGNLVNSTVIALYDDRR